jgi:hypothetical protein
MVESFLVTLPTRAASSRAEPKPPVGVIESLTAGFETVASHLGLILFPALLDLFLWLGPRLSINPMMARFISFINSVPAGDAEGLQSRAVIVELFKLLGERTNLFSFLSTSPLGIPSLMAGQFTDRFPDGQPLTWSISSFLLFLTLALAFTITGLLIGTMYFYSISINFADEGRPSLLEMLTRVMLNWAKLTSFGIMVGLTAFFASVPIFLIIGLLSMLSPGLAAIGQAVWGAMMMWALLYLAFSMHGMVLKNRSVFGAIWDSIRLVQWNLLSVMGLFIIIFLLNWGLGYLWGLPGADSWLTLAGIGGHAFVSTALVAATFAFYKDRYRWWVEMRQWLLAQKKK